MNSSHANNLLVLILGSEMNNQHKTLLKNTQVKNVSTQWTLKNQNVEYTLVFLGFLLFSHHFYTWEMRKWFKNETKEKHKLSLENLMMRHTGA